MDRRQQCSDGLSGILIEKSTTFERKEDVFTAYCALRCPQKAYARRDDAARMILEANRAMREHDEIVQNRKINSECRIDENAIVECVPE